MSKIENLSDIEKIIVHWSESTYINDTLDPLDEGGGDIEKEVDALAFNSIVKHASTLIEEGYDKTSLSVKKKGDNNWWCIECKFYITKSKNTLLALLNAGE